MAFAAEPILASTLCAVEASIEQASKYASRSTKIPTGNHKVDAALEGGLDHGSVSCISGEAGTGAREVAQALLISHILGTPTAVATVVVTSLSLDVRKLHTALMRRIRRGGGAAEEAARALDRVKIMKVFDFAGMNEGLAELRDSLDGKEILHESVQPQETLPKSTIVDSDEEGEDEMLDDPMPAPKVAAQKYTPRQQQEPVIRSDILIIDNLSQLAAPLLKNNYVQGQALLSSFMRSLSHLTKMHNLCTVLLNDAAPNRNGKEETPSIFQSNTLQPALGKSFTYTLDTHLLIHHGSDGTTARGSKGSEEQVVVVEVLQDRHGGRFGRWAGFRLDGDGDLMDLT